LAQVSINGNQYDVYADVAFADRYLAADASRADAWQALTATGAKERALVSATRLLQRQTWNAGVAPDVAMPVEIVQEAASLLAADIAAAPGIGDSGSTASNVKSVGAGPARVEFFAPTVGTPLPMAAFALLLSAGLLGARPGAVDDPALDGSAYGCWPQASRFDPTDYELLNFYPAGGPLYG
jgi:hypothetical protein